MPRKEKTTEPPAPEQTAEPKPWSEPDQPLAELQAAMAELGYPNGALDPLPDFVAWELDLPENLPLDAAASRETTYAVVRNLLLDVIASSSPPAEAKEDIHRTEDYLAVTRPFNEEQQQAFLKQLYDLQHDHEHMKGEMEYHKDLAKNAQKSIDSINDQIHGILKTLEAGHEESDVLCEKVLNYTTGLVSWFVKDTGEFVSKRALAKSERQRKLNFHGGTEDDDPEDFVDLDEGPDPTETGPENTLEEESHDPDQPDAD